MKGLASVRLLLGLVLLPGCDGILGPGDDPEPAIRTDRESYAAVPVFPDYSQYAFTVITTFTNPTGDTLYLDRCYPDTPYPIYGVGREDDQEVGWNAAWACVGTVPFAMAPGETRVDTLRITGPNAFTRSGEPMGVLWGTFRLGFAVKSCSEAGPCPDPVPGYLRQSNAFRVEPIAMDL
jgi:hypothetical protein